MDNKEAILEQADKILKHYIDAVQETFGIYKMTNKHDVVMYVGKAKNLKQRLRSYRRFPDLSPRIRYMLCQLATISFIYTDKESDAFLLEARLIKQLRPRYNLIMKDDRSLSYVGLTQGLFPPAIVGSSNKRVITGECYGPFISVKAAQRTIDSLTQTFRLRTCPDSFYKGRTEPCLQHHIGRCSAPCVQKISYEDYMHDVQSARNFLKGDWAQVQENIESVKTHAVSEENYALAERCQERLEMINKHMATKVDVGLPNVRSVAVIGYATEDDYINFFVRVINAHWDYGEGEYFSTNARELTEPEALSAFIMQFYSNREVPDAIVVPIMPHNLELVQEALAQVKCSEKVEIIHPATEEMKGITLKLQESARRNMRERVKMRQQMESVLNTMQEIFGFVKPIRRVEVYDNSHLQMTNAFGAMVVFSANGFFKNGYRKFAFKNPLAYRQNDAIMMAEVVRRRLAMDDLDLPDLMVLDGGRHQLNKVKAVLDEHKLDIQLIAMAKQPEGNAEIFYLDETSDPVSVEDPQVLLFLRRVRDEAHRYVLTCHRMRRNRAMVSNGDEKALIPGIGEVRWARLKEHFGSVENIYSATVEELMAVQGFNRRIAESIVFYLSKNKSAVAEDE